MYVIEILNTEKCWVASWKDGDPPRTTVFMNAQTFYNKKDAEKRITEIKKTHPFKQYFYKITKASNF